MFDRIKKAVFGGPGVLPRAALAATPQAAAQVSKWANTRGLSVGVADGGGTSLNGMVGGKPWRLECGASSRDYIQGVELRARAELGVNPDASLVVMNRSLKDMLEKRAYSVYTDDTQTLVDPKLSEEMRWLALYPEAQWDGLPRGFWLRFAVMADQEERALAWLKPALAQLLLEWPQPSPALERPFVLAVMRGRVYLRMEHLVQEVATLQHAAAIFVMACESAQAGLSGR